MLINGFTETRRHLAIAAAAVPAVTAAGCGPAPSAPPTDGGPFIMTVIRDDANRTTVPVAVGGRVELILSSSY